MIACLYSLPERVLQEILEDPRKLPQLLTSEDPAAGGTVVPEERESLPGGRLGRWLLKMLGWKPPAPGGHPRPSPVDRLSVEPGSVQSLDLGKSWHGIHFMLTGTAWEGFPPLYFLVEGGESLGDEDWGYGPARGFDAGFVRELARALNGIPPEDLDRRYDPVAMTKEGIYPGIWDRGEEEDALGYCREYYRELRDFVQAAADRGHALVATLE